MPETKLPYFAEQWMKRSLILGCVFIGIGLSVNQPVAEWFKQITAEINNQNNKVKANNEETAASRAATSNLVPAKVAGIDLKVTAPAFATGASLSNGTSKSALARNCPVPPEMIPGADIGRNPFELKSAQGFNSHEASQKSDVVGIRPNPVEYRYEVRQPKVERRLISGPVYYYRASEKSDVVGIRPNPVEYRYEVTQPQTPEKQVASSPSSKRKR